MISPCNNKLTRLPVLLMDEKWRPPSIDCWSTREQRLGLNSRFCPAYRVLHKLGTGSLLCVVVDGEERPVSSCIHLCTVVKRL